MKIYDCITFFNELDLLELRMEELDQYVDYFVINEVDTTFSGKPKPLYYAENKERFAKFHHKILYNMATDTAGDNWNHWDRDINHKNVVGAVLNTMHEKGRVNDDDIIIYSDADEIPNLHNVDFNEVEDNELYICMQKLYYHTLNTFYEDQWRGSRFCNYRTFKQGSPNDHRDYDGKIFKELDKIYVPNAGWHFSFLGDTKAIKTKIEAWSHQELNRPDIKDNIEERVKNNMDIFNRPQSKLTVVPIDDTYPQYVLENPEKYNKYVRSM